MECKHKPKNKKMTAQCKLASGSVVGSIFVGPSLIGELIVWSAAKSKRETAFMIFLGHNERVTI